MWAADESSDFSFLEKIYCIIERAFRKFVLDYRFMFEMNFLIWSGLGFNAFLDVKKRKEID